MKILYLLPFFLLIFISSSSYASGFLVQNPFAVTASQVFTFQSPLSISSNYIVSCSACSGASGLTTVNAPIFIDSNNAISITTSSATSNGFLLSKDWKTFNTVNLMAYQFTVANSLIYSSNVLSITQSSSSSNGFLSSTDWNTFNSKAGNYLSTNDVTGQSAADSLLCKYTPSVQGTFRIGGYTTVTAISTDVLQFRVIYIDETGTTRTQTFFVQGATSGNMGTTGSFTYPTMDIRSSANNAIVVNTILTTSIGSITYDTGCSIIGVS
jgi:hypothetical protein